MIRTPARHGVIGLVLLGALAFTATLDAQSASIQIGSGAGRIGTSVSIPITISTSDPGDAFSMGVLHRSTSITPVSVVVGQALIDLNGTTTDQIPAFMNVNLSPTLPAGDPTAVGGWTVGMVLDFDLSVVTRLPAAVNQELLVATYGIVPTASAGTSTLEGSSLLGTPPVSLLAVLSVAGDPIEVAISPAPGVITIQNAPFMRGDVDSSGSVSLVDGVLLLYRMFGLQPLGSCADAEDINDDGIVGLQDAVTLFQYMFSGTTPPQTLGVCGDDPTSTDTLGCAVSTCG
jgi:hypothetical protein